MNIPHRAAAMLRPHAAKAHSPSAVAAMLPAPVGQPLLAALVESVEAGCIPHLAQLTCREAMVALRAQAAHWAAGLALQAKRS